MEPNKMVNADVKNTRTEFDLLGSREVPEDAYYGINTVRAMENFRISHSSMNDYPQFIYGMVQVKKAAAMANRELRLLPKDIADAIVSACDHILKDGYCITQFPVDVFQGGAGTSTNMNVNEVVANLALELMGHEKGIYKYCNPNDHVNLCQSTNDAYPCGLKLAFLEDLTSLYTTMEFLAETLTLKAGEFEGVLKMGRTQLQDAVPMTLMEEFEAFALWVQNDIAHIKRCSKELLEFNLGGTAVGTGLNAVRGYAELAVGRLATNTGHPCILASNLVAASPDCGAYVAVHSALKRFAVRLSKICNDLRLMSSGPRAGLGEIQLPERQAGSSIMPAKVNPVIPEVVNQVCFKVCGNDTTITMAAEAGQLQLNVMEPVIAECMFQSISLLRNASQSLAEKCITGIRANVDRCESNVMNSIGIVTYLCPQLGHHLCDIIGRECVNSGKSVRQVVEEQKLLPMEVLDDIFSKANLQYPRDIAERFD